MNVTSVLHCFSLKLKISLFSAEFEIHLDISYNKKLFTFFLYISFFEIKIKNFHLHEDERSDLLQFGLFNSPNDLFGICHVVEPGIKVLAHNFKIILKF